MREIIRKLRKVINEDRRKGCRCPICDQYVKEYTRYINTPMIRGLCLLAMWYQYNDRKFKKWVHFENYINSLDPVPKIRGDFAKLRFWALIESNSDDNGYYRITSRGWDFIVNGLKIEKTITTYNNKLIRVSDEYVSIIDCLNDNLTYKELLEFRNHLK